MLHKHHIIPKHMGEDNSPKNLTPPICIELHAALHEDLYNHFGKTEDFIAMRLLRGQSLAGMEMSLEMRKRISESMKLHKRTPKHCENIRKAQLNRDPEINKRAALTRTGQKRSEEQKEKFSKITKNRYQNNPESHPMLGKQHSDASKKKISDSKLGIIPWNKGLKNPQVVSEETRTKLSAATKLSWEKRRAAKQNLEKKIKEF